MTPVRSFPLRLDGFSTSISCNRQTPVWIYLDNAVGTALPARPFNHRSERHIVDTVDQVVLSLVLMALKYSQDLTRFFKDLANFNCIINVMAPFVFVQ